MEKKYVVSVRFTKEQMDKIKVLAEEECRSLSGWCRHQILLILESKPIPVVEVSKSELDESPLPSILAGPPFLRDYEIRGDRKLKR